MTSKRKIGFLGAGKMATALATGFLKAPDITPVDIVGYDIYPQASEYFKTQTGCQTTDSLPSLLSDNSILFLAVKPQSLLAACKELSDVIKSDHLVVSIAAGVTLAQLQKALPSEQRIIRVMPNTPCLVECGASAISGGDHATKDDIESIVSLLSHTGIAVEVPETQMDAVTGLSGSGPAYIMLIIEAMADGAVKMGLPREVALKLAAQTVAGAGKLVQQTGMHPAVLKDQVCSPGGTTITGLHTLEQNGIRAAMMDAVEMATYKSIELGATQ